MATLSESSDFASLERPSLLREDPAAALYRHHSGWLLAFLRRRFTAQDAEDLAQETFVQVVGARPDIRNPRAFLARVALNTAGMQARKQRVRPRFVAEAAIPPGVCEPADQEQVLLLKQAILALPPRLREVFLLSRFAGLTYEEIAHRCGVSVKTGVGLKVSSSAISVAAIRAPGASNPSLSRSRKLVSAT